MDNWEIAKLYPQEMKVLSSINQHLCFQWEVGLTYIHRLRPNFEIGSLVGRNIKR